MKRSTVIALLLALLIALGSFFAGPDTLSAKGSTWAKTPTTTTWAGSTWAGHHDTAGTTTWAGRKG